MLNDNLHIIFLKDADIGYFESRSNKLKKLLKIWRIRAKQIESLPSLNAVIIHCKCPSALDRIKEFNIVNTLVPKVSALAGILSVREALIYSARPAHTYKKQFNSKATRVTNIIGFNAFHTTQAGMAGTIALLAGLDPTGVTFLAMLTYGASRGLSKTTHNDHKWLGLGGQSFKGSITEEMIYLQAQAEIILLNELRAQTPEKYHEQYEEIITDIIHKARKSLKKVIVNGQKQHRAEKPIDFFNITSKELIRDHLNHIQQAEDLKKSPKPPKPPRR